MIPKSNLLLLICLICFRWGSAQDQGSALALIKSLYENGNCAERTAAFDAEIVHQLSQQEYPEALLWIAKCSYRARDYDRAIAIAHSGVDSIIQSGLSREFLPDLYQLIADCHYRKFDSKTALNYRLMEIAEREQQGKTPKHLGNACMDAGLIYLNAMADFDNAVAFQKKAIQLLNSVSDSLGLASAFLNIGLAYHRLDRADQSRDYFKQAVDICERKAPFSSVLPRAYFSLGRYYKNIQNPDRAIFYLEKAVRHLEAHHPADPLMFTASRELGDLYRKNARYEQAIKVFALPLGDRAEEKSKHRLYAEADCHFEIGKTRMLQDKPDEATRQFEMCMTMMQAAYGENHVFLTYPIAEKVFLALHAKDTLKALKQIDEGMKILARNEAFVHADYAMLNLRYAQALRKLGKPDEALLFLNKSYAAVGFNPDSSKTYGKVLRYDVLSKTINAYTDLAFALYQARKDPKTTGLLENQLKVHITFLDSLQQFNLDPASSLEIMEDNARAYRIAMDFYYAQYRHSGAQKDLSLALNIAEKSRDLLLRETSAKHRLRQEDLIPEPLVEEEADLQMALAAIEVESFQKKEEARSTEAKRQKILGDLEQVRDEIRRYTRAHEYFRTHLNSREIRNLAKAKDATILEYFIDSASSYCIGIAPAKEVFIKIECDAGEIRALYQLLCSAGSDVREFEESSHRVYQAILDPVLTQLGTDTGNLIIVPHGPLSYIPFETLVSDPGQPASFADLNYLIRRYNINYANSLHTLIERSTFRSRKGFAGFAPQYNKLRVLTKDTTDSESFAVLVRSGDYALPGARREVESIHEMIGGKLYIGEAASASNFKRDAPKYGILHLSMHALVEESNPGLSRLLFTQTAEAHEDSYVFVNELSNMPLNAELAVLSACNTGFGKIARGEGMMSISRALFYAGVKSTVHSLWKVPDEATSEIMIAFYKNLSDGLPKGRALHEAKRDYLQQVIAPERSHPFYWAGFVASGQLGPVDLGSDGRWPYLAVAFILAFVLFLVMRRLRS